MPADPETVWANLLRLDDYEAWWPWLRRFVAHGLAPGEKWDCTIKPPVPWSIRVTVAITGATPHRRICAEVSGDVAGQGQLDIRPTEEGSQLRIRSSLAPASPVLRAAALLAAPVSRFGHDWVLDTGSRQFRTHMQTVL